MNIKIISPILLSLFWLYAPSAFCMNADETIRHRVRISQRQGVLKEVKSNALSSCLLAGGAACTTYFSPALGTMAVLGGIFALKDTAQNVAAHYGYWEKGENSKLAQTLNELEETYYVNEEKITAFNRREILKLINDARRDIGFGVKKVHDSNLDKLRRLLSKIENILSLPTQKAQPLLDGDVLENLSQYLQTYAEDVRQDVLLAAIKIQRYGLAPVNKKASQKASFFFVGEAGVGKTVTAEKIAEATGRPFCKLTLNSLEDLQGKAATDVWTGAGAVLGELARCFISPDSGEAATNPIIFIDEIHDIINGSKDGKKLYSKLKILTEKNETRMLEHSLGVELNIEAVTFIFAGNARIKDDTAGAFATRVTTVDFSNISTTHKIAIAHNAYRAQCAMFNYEPDEQTQKLDFSIITEIAESDASPGVRSLLATVDAYILFQCTNECWPGICEKFDIQKTLEKNGGIFVQSLSEQ